MSQEKVQFTTAAGHRLAGRIAWPEGPVRGGAVFAHCFTCGKDIKAAARIASALAAQGLAVLRFDFTGLGESEGEFACGFSADVADLVAAVGALRERVPGPTLLIGHSLGGAAALAAAARLGDLAGVAAIAAPYAPAHVLHQFGEGIAAIEADGAAEVRLGGRPFRVGRGFLDDVRAQDQTSWLSALRTPVLLLHAPGDEVVSAADARRIYNALPGPRSFVALDGADHLLTRAADADYAAAMIVAWAGRYLPAAAA